MCYLAAIVWPVLKTMSDLDKQPKVPDEIKTMGKMIKNALSKR